jgi:hypothetical protein
VRMTNRIKLFVAITKYYFLDIQLLTNPQLKIGQIKF